MKVPCYKDGKHCEKRHPNCHSECEEYQAFWRANREKSEKRMRENEAVSTIINQKRKLYHRSQKLKWKRGSGNNE